MSTWAIVLAAGRGRRFGGEMPKQYLPLGDRRVLDWSLDAARASTDGVVLVVGADRREDPEPLADAVVVGGAERADSVRAGLAALPTDCEIVLVHDGARPLASPDLYAAVIEAVAGGASGAIPALAVTDTIKRVDADGRVLETVPRSDLVAVQTPQGFRVDVLRRAHAHGGDATDDAALLERNGDVVVVVPGETENLKITRPEDLPAATASIIRRAGG